MRSSALNSTVELSLQRIANGVRRCFSRLAFVAFLGLIAAGGAQADELDQASMEWFEKHVRPTLVEHCIRCHGPDKQQGGLRLDTREGWAKGGDNGPAVIPGDDASLLLRAIRYEDIELEMPPRGKLPEKTLEAFAAWVATGAVDPRHEMQDASSPDASDSSQPEGLTPPSIDQGREFWSFRPVVVPDVPAVGTGWAINDMDRFVYSRLRENGLDPNPDADASVLLRRVFYDLIGLPPTPEQIDEFLNDTSPNAYESLVDRLLESHHFGERWGRHWLDVVRFAESSGGGRTLMFPNAWRYRDYVIESFNRDVPYDQFLIQQIAGDLLECEDWQQQSRNLTATAFLLLGPINYEMQDKDILEMDIVDEQLDTIGKALMGMTIGCARCHDHKFDPIPARDYYAMAGILKSTDSVIHSNVSKWNTADLPLPPEEAEKHEQYERQLAQLQRELKSTKRQWILAGGNDANGKDANESIDPLRIDGIVLDDIDAQRVGSWTQSDAIASYVGEYYIHDATEGKGRKHVVYEPELAKSGRYEILVSYSAASNRSTRVPVRVHHADGESIIRVNQKTKPPIEGVFESLGQFDLTPDSVKVVISNEGTEDGVVIADTVVLLPADRATSVLISGKEEEEELAEHEKALIEQLEREMKTLESRIKSLQETALKRPVAMATTDANQPGDIHLAIRGQAHMKGELVSRGVMQVASWDKFPSIAEDQSGRKELAHWIADARHPLTARVMANRVWYWLTGRGIVPTVDNFGSMGQQPTHPELLDHLATTFVQRGWSIKQLIREIVLSRTYRMSSAPTAESVAIDPDNRWYWRMNRKRLRAEDIRDSLLLVSGRLDYRYGGSNIKPGTSIEYGYEFTSTRRSVYVPVFRNALPEVFEVFDFADPNTQAGRRSSSTVPSQALWMMNHPMVIARTEDAARRLLDEIPGNEEIRIRQASLQVLSRPPTEREYAVAVDLVAFPGDNESGASEPALEDAVDRYAMLYRVLFQCLDFRYLD